MMTGPRFQDRAEAGRKLAGLLDDLKDERPVILALPRGGVPVAAEIARALNAPLDVLLVCKIGLPGQPELAYAAVVDGAHPELVLNEDIAGLAEVPEDYLAGERARCLEEIFSFSTTVIGATGPNVSSFAILISGVMFLRIVGW